MSATRPSPADTPTGSELLTVRDVSTAVALELITRVHQESADRGLCLAAAVVDRGGNLVAAARMDGAQLGSLGLATDKAFTAVSFGHPTSAWASSSGPGGSDWGLAGSLGGRAIVFPGGIPLYDSGELVGGLGVSGAASVVDAECATAAAGSVGLQVTR